ncbi:MAG: hypothetical protein ABIR17_03520 [Pseudolysinimonas sp.]|uniref:hypothetical protein n=1 Tax=Pseudolysinimonas sp. TaxID=2680009 RepID=UPI003265285C
MELLATVSNVLFALHMFGLAAIVGGFFVQLRHKVDFVLWPLLAGAITQVVTGLGMVGIAQTSTDDKLNMAWVGVKLVIAVIVLIAAIVAVVQKRRGGRVQPWFHAAGGLAVINVLVATLWH